MAEASPSAGSREQVHLVMYDATGQGGVARTVNLLAGRLSETRPVHVVSLMRNRDRPVFPLDPAVEISWLLDNRGTGPQGGRPRNRRRRGGARRRLDLQPSSLEDEPGTSAYTDLLLREALSGLTSGIVITTRPMLHLAAARWLPASVPRIAQDHLNFDVRMRNEEVRRLLDAAIPGSDALVTLTEGDRQDYARRYPTARVVRIPNASPYGVSDGGPTPSRIVVGAGRLVRRKGFDRLIDAWAPVAASFPDWQLHIYGEGECRADLERQVASLGLQDAIVLAGYTDDLAGVLSRAEVFALSSRSEGFPMVLLEAASLGLPQVGFDCPRGPAEIIQDGVTGRLVPDGDITAYSAALGDLLADPTSRAEMGAAARHQARAFEIGPVARAWEQLIDEVAADHGRADTRDRLPLAGP